MTDPRSIAAELRYEAARLTALAELVEGLEAETNGACVTEGERLLSAEEVVQRTGLPRGRVYALGRRGELGAIRVGERGVRFSDAGLRQWLRQGGSA